MWGEYKSIWQANKVKSALWEWAAFLGCVGGCQAVEQAEAGLCLTCRCNHTVNSGSLRDTQHLAQQPWSCAHNGSVGAVSAPFCCWISAEQCSLTPKSEGGILQALGKQSGHDSIMSNISSSLRCGFHVTCSSIVHSKAHYSQFWFAFSIYDVWLLTCWSKARSWGSCETWDLFFQVLAWLHEKFSQKWFASPSLSHCRGHLWKW